MRVNKPYLMVALPVNKSVYLSFLQGVEGGISFWNEAFLQQRWQKDDCSDHPSPVKESVDHEADAGRGFHDLERIAAFAAFAAASA